MAASFRWYVECTADRLPVSIKSHLLELLTTRKLIGEGGKCLQFEKQTWHFNQEDQKDEVMLVPAGETWKSNTLWYKCFWGIFFSVFLFFWLRAACQQGRSSPIESQVTSGGGAPGWWDPKGLSAEESEWTNSWWEDSSVSTNLRQRYF